VRGRRLGREGRGRGRRGVQGDGAEDRSTTMGSGSCRRGTRRSAGSGGCRRLGGAGALAVDRGRSRSLSQARSRSHSRSRLRLRPFSPSFGADMHSTGASGRMYTTSSRSATWASPLTTLRVGRRHWQRRQGMQMRRNEGEGERAGELPEEEVGERSVGGGSSSGTRGQATRFSDDMHLQQGNWESWEPWSGTTATTPSLASARPSRISARCVPKPSSNASPPHPSPHATPVAPQS